MYRVIGKRPTMTPECETAADRWLNVTIGAAMIGHALREMPDGIVIESEGCYFETWRGELRGIDPDNPGTMNTEPRAVPVECDPVALAKFIHIEALRFRDGRAQ